MDNLRELNKLIEKGGRFADENLAFANKMMAQVPEDKQGEMKEAMKNIRSAVKDLDKGKLMDVLKDLKNHGR